MNPSDSKRTPDHFDAYRTTNESPAVAPRDPNRRSPVRVLPTSVRAQNASHPNIDALIASDLQPLMAQKLNIGSPSNGNSNDNDATAAPTENQNNPNVETETIDWEKECNYMDGVFDEQSKEQLKGLPAYHKPKYFKKEINPYPHQRLGIRWLIQQERNPKDNPFVKSREMKDGSIGYYDSLQNHRKIDKPYGPAKGSILADGKFLNRHS